LNDPEPICDLFAAALIVVDSVSEVILFANAPGRSWFAGATVGANFRELLPGWNWKGIVRRAMRGRVAKFQFPRPMDGMSVQATLIKKQWNSQEVLVLECHDSERVRELDAMLLAHSDLLESANSELKRSNREVLKSSRIKDHFLTAVTHELRAPLHVVLGLTDALISELYGDVNSSQEEKLKTVQEHGGKLLNIINDILEFTSVCATDVDLDVDRVDLAIVCQSVVSGFRRLAEKKGLEVVVPPLDSFMINCDERRLVNALGQLLANAIKFTDPGGQIGIELEVHASAGKAVVCVWDTGVGVAPELHSQIFEPFFQIDAGRNRRSGGTGLGLSLARRIVSLHGGTIRVVSSLGEGSQFIVSIEAR
jgi:signal transduction histidine kinase